MCAGTQAAEQETTYVECFCCDQFQASTFVHTGQEKIALQQLTAQAIKQRSAMYFSRLKQQYKENWLVCTSQFKLRLCFT